MPRPHRVAFFLSRTHGFAKLRVYGQSDNRGKSESELIRRARGGDQRAWDELLTTHRERLRRMISLRLDHRLRGRVDPSDVIQDAYLDATAGFAQFVDRAEMPFFLWLRWLAGMRLNTLHRKHLGYQVRDAAA